MAKPEKRTNTNLNLGLLGLTQSLNDAVFLTKIQAVSSGILESLGGAYLRTAHKHIVECMRATIAQRHRDVGHLAVHVVLRLDELSAVDLA